MLLMIVLGLVTTLFGVVLGSAVLELTVRAVAHSLADRPGEGSTQTGSWFAASGSGVS